MLLVAVGSVVAERRWHWTLEINSGVVKGVV